MQNQTIHKLSEEVLIARLRARDDQAITILYDMYSANLYGVILQIVKVEEIAEDVLQEAFIKIWKSFEHYDEKKGRLFTWMLNLSRNLAIDKIRSKEYRMQVATETLPNPGKADFITDDYKPEHMDLRNMVNKLHPDQKHIIDLMYFEGLTQSEISKKYSIPLGTVKTRARSAVKFLASYFKGSV